jgi:hypothetical protein
MTWRSLVRNLVRHHVLVVSYLYFNLTILKILLYITSIVLRP